MVGPTTYTSVVNGVRTTITAEEYNNSPITVDANRRADQIRNDLLTPAATSRATQAIGTVDPTPLDQGTSVATQASIPQSDQFTDPNRISTNAVNQLGQAPNTARLLPNNSFNNIAKALGLNFNPEPNPLNQYANYTYHIRWFMTSVSESYNNISGINPNSSQLTKTVIAESGVTAGFNIVELRIHAATTANRDKRNMWCLTEIDMVISEPLGLSLLDKIYYSAKSIGIINHLRCPYFLEVWFNGYDEDGNLAANNLYYNIYRVNFQDVEAATTQVGTTYNIKFYGDNATGESNQLAIPNAGLSIPATNLGAFFDQLAASLNRLQLHVNNDGIPRTVYQFQYPNSWKNWNMRPADTDRNTNRNESMNAADGAPGTGTVIKIASGQAMETIINNAVYSCKEAQDFITGNNGGAAGGASFSQHGMIGYVSVYAITKLTGIADPVSGDYTREITYVLWRAESARAYTDPGSVREASTPAVQTSKLQYLVQQRRLNKRYDYIYTGLNTEIVTFDFKINMTWMFTNPAWVQANAYGQYAQGPLVNPTSIGYALQRGTLPLDRVAPIANQPIRQDSVTGGAGPNTQVGIAPTAAIGAQTAALAAGGISLNASPGQLAAYQAALTAVGNARGAANIQNLINYRTTRQQTLATTYAEDTKNDQNGLLQPPLPVVSVYSNEPQTQNAQQSTDQAKVNVDTDVNNYPSGTGFVGAVMGNLFSPGAAEMQNIEITIRGDPWWIPSSNISQNARVVQLTGNDTNQTTNSNQLQADYTGGDNMFLLETRVGVVIDENTGLAVTDGNGADFFNGVYVLYEVECQFSHGKFTQRLKAYKDILSQNPIPSSQTSTAGTGRRDN